MRRLLALEAAAHRWSRLADTAPDGSLRERACRALARQATRHASAAYLRLVSPREAAWVPTVPVREIDPR